MVSGAIFVGRCGKTLENMKGVQGVTISPLTLSTWNVPAVESSLTSLENDTLSFRVMLTKDVRSLKSSSDSVDEQKSKRQQEQDGVKQV